MIFLKILRYQRGATGVCTPPAGVRAPSRRGVQAQPGPRPRGRRRPCTRSGAPQACAQKRADFFYLATNPKCRVRFICTRTSFIFLYENEARTSARQSYLDFLRHSKVARSPPCSLKTWAVTLERLRKLLLLPPSPSPPPLLLLHFGHWYLQPSQHSMKTSSSPSSLTAFSVLVPFSLVSTVLPFTRSSVFMSEPDKLLKKTKIKVRNRY